MENVSLERNVWAIQLKESEFGKLTFESELETIRFNWQDISVPETSSMSSIQFSVARVRPDYTDKQVKNIASAIRNTRLAKKGDFILGVQGDKTIKKIGAIDSLERTSLGATQMSIEWSEDLPELVATKAIFNEDIPIEPVTARMLSYTPIDFAFLKEIAPHFFRNVLYSAKYARGEAAMMLNDLEAGYEHTDKKDLGSKIKIFYGTNRKKTGLEEFNQFYGKESGELIRGWCEVSIPKGHMLGHIERPSKILRIIPQNENIDKHICLVNIEEQETDVFLKSLSQIAAEYTGNAALLFVHGYNMDFMEAAHRTAQIAYDIPFNGPAGFFSWPSSGTFSAYPRDIEVADASLNKFQMFIEDLLEKTGIEQLHIIAHSMGNRLLTACFDKLASKQNYNAQLKVIREIILAAPDLDQDVFLNNILPNFKTIGNNRTLYVSDKDKALRMSELMRGGLPRLGSCGRNLFVAQGVDTIDASNIESDGTKHSYVFEADRVLGDLFHLFGYGKGPQYRRLRSRLKDNIPYWLFPE